jgi:hypothetical protein
MVTHPQPQSVQVSNAESAAAQAQPSSEDTFNQLGIEECVKPGETKSIRRGRFSVVTHKPGEIEEVVPLSEYPPPQPLIPSQQSAFVSPQGVGGGGGNNEGAYFPQPQQYFHQQPFPHQYMAQQGFIPASFSPAPLPVRTNFF